VKLELDRSAFALPIVDGQANLATSARITPSSIRENDPQRWGTQFLFDNLGDTAWDSAPGEMHSTLEFDLGSAKMIGSASFAQMAQRDGWNQVFEYELKVREDEHGDWRTAYKNSSPLGGIPVLEFNPVRARFVRLEMVKRWKQVPAELGELRLFAPLEGTGTPVLRNNSDP
jgi:hypothetical protein